MSVTTEIGPQVTEAGSRTSPIMLADLDIPLVWKDGSFKATTLAEEPIDQPQSCRKSVCRRGAKLPLKWP